MNTTLKFDRVILIKELNDKFKRVGDIFEIANILDNSFLLRDAKTKVALGVVSFEDFERCFVHEENHKGWTPWTPMMGFDGQSDIVYKTNRKKVIVKFLTDNVRAESCCCSGDEFNLTFGLHLAYLRCLNKALTKRQIEHLKTIAECETELAKITRDMTDNNRIMKKMLNSLND